MQFTNFTFLIGFFPVCWLLYQLIPPKYKNLYLLFASLVFYAYGAIENFLVLLFILAWNYLNARQIEQTWQPKKKKWILVETLVVNVLVLFFYKYFFVWVQAISDTFGLGLALQEPAIPLGLSFYIFTTLTAVIQIYWGKETLCSIVDFGLFAAFFAWVNMGPIEHYPAMKEQLSRHPITKASLSQGAALFFQGMGYKVILADNLSNLFGQFASTSTLLAAWMMSLCYFFELYFDFCGYSRMARGIASCFGFVVPPNFSHPYRALSIQDYWRRWHISLTNWFRTYIYIPLGGNRVSQAKWIRNVFVVWSLTGLWHGAALSFVFWGAYQACFILMERLVYPEFFEKSSTWLQHAYVILVAVLGDVFFYAGSLGNAMGIYGRMIGIGISGLFDNITLFGISQGLVLLCACAFFVSPLPERLAAWLEGKTGVNYPWISFTGYACLFLICLSFLTSSTAQTFLYAAF